MTIIIGVVHFERFVSGDIENYESKKRKLVAVAVAVEHIRTRSGSATRKPTSGDYSIRVKRNLQVFFVYTMTIFIYVAAI